MDCRWHERDGFEVAMTLANVLAPYACLKDSQGVIAPSYRGDYQSAAAVGQNRSGLVE